MEKRNFSGKLLVSMLLVFHLVSVAAAETVQVAVSIPPQIYFVNQIGGELVDVFSMLPEGAFPHTFEPTAKQMKLLSKADLYVRIGVEFENAWWDKMLAVNPRMHVVDSTVGIDFIEGDAQHHPEGSGQHNDRPDDHAEGMRVHAGRDPHVWLSPRMVKIQAEAICEGLIQVDPNNKETYVTNKNIFLNALDELDQDIQKILASVKTRKFMVFHPSWSYFARDYNLEELPIELEGKEPSAAEMMQIMKMAKQENIRVIFVQPQTSRRSTDTIAKQIGAGVDVINPLAANWMENMRSVAKVLAEALNK